MNQAVESTESYREIRSDQLHISLSSKLNDSMKALTVYSYIWAAMITVAMGKLAYFKKRKWL